MFSVSSQGARLGGSRGLGFVTEGGLGLSDDFVERAGGFDGHVGHDLAVQFDIGGDEALDEAAVGQATGADAGADTGDPQGAEVALAVFTVAGGPGLRFEDGVLGVAIEAGTVSVETLGLLEDPLAALA